jgi:asparagine synthase (glutamine-hydrolysing)
MCSIAGYLNCHDYENIFFDSMRHRGPDYEESINIDSWSLLHQRLSIIDVSKTGNQPMSKGGNIIVFNGELYNYIELRDQYLKNEILFSTSDTEILLTLLNRYGIEILNVQGNPPAMPGRL